MRRAVAWSLAAVLFATGGWGLIFPAVGAQTGSSANIGTDSEDWGGLPPGEGREDVFYLCQACHSLKTVLQQRLNRRRWDQILEWMVEEQGMPELEPEEHARVLDYLGTHLAPDTPR